MVDRSRLVDFFERIAPPFLAYDWDNSGFQVGCGRDRIEKLVIGLDPSNPLLNFALRKKADLVVTHHPLIFDSLKKIDLRTPLGGKIEKMIDNEVGLFSIHTNFDRARNGLSEALASCLGLASTEPIAKVKGAKFKKVVVFLPPEAEQKMKQAIFSMDGGKGDLYREVSFVARGRGSFKPLEGADPYLGEVGKREETEELRLEIQVSKERLNAVEEVIESQHPYEQPAYDVFETEKIDDGVGLGRIGEWKEARRLEEAVSSIEDRMSLSDSELEVVGDPETPVKSVGVSPGSGGGVMDEILSSRADLFVTGELDYHERQALREVGLPSIELGHRNSEKIFSPWLKDMLSESFSGGELSISTYEEDEVAPGS